MTNKKLKLAKYATGIQEIMVPPVPKYGAGNALMDVGSMAATGAQFGPVGAIAGGVLGGIKALGSLGAKKRAQRKADEAKRLNQAAQFTNTFETQDAMNLPVAAEGMQEIPQTMIEVEGGELYLTKKETSTDKKLNTKYGLEMKFPKGRSHKEGGIVIAGTPGDVIIPKRLAKKVEGLIKSNDNLQIEAIIQTLPSETTKKKFAFGGPVGDPTKPPKNKTVTASSTGSVLPNVNFMPVQGRNLFNENIPTDGNSMFAAAQEEYELPAAQLAYINYKTKPPRTLAERGDEVPEGLTSYLEREASFKKMQILEQPKNFKKGGTIPKYPFGGILEPMAKLGAGNMDFLNINPVGADVGQLPVNSGTTGPNFLDKLGAIGGKVSPALNLVSGISNLFTKNPTPYQPTVYTPKELEYQSQLPLQQQLIENQYSTEEGNIDNYATSGQQARSQKQLAANRKRLNLGLAVNQDVQGRSQTRNQNIQLQNQAQEINFQRQNQAKIMNDQDAAAVDNIRRQGLADLSSGALKIRNEKINQKNMDRLDATLGSGLALKSPYFKYDPTTGLVDFTNLTPR